MNVFGKRARGWRKGKKRGVSPIIATILLVAITVVLAAVLYVLISGLTGHGNATPLGTAFGFGSATQQTGTASTNAFCKTGDNCWEVAISAASGPTISELSFLVKTSGGSAGTATVTIVNLAQTQCVSAGSSGSGTWTACTASGTVTGGLATSTTVTPTMEIWVDGGTATVFGQGWTLTAYGSGGFSGSVGPSGLP